MKLSWEQCVKRARGLSVEPSKKEFNIVLLHYSPATLAVLFSECLKTGILQRKAHIFCVVSSFLW